MTDPEHVEDCGDEPKLTAEEWAAVAELSAVSGRRIPIREGNPDGLQFVQPAEGDV